MLIIVILRRFSPNYFKNKTLRSECPCNKDILVLHSLSKSHLGTMSPSPPSTLSPSYAQTTLHWADYAPQWLLQEFWWAFKYSRLPLKLILVCHPLSRLRGYLQFWLCTTGSQVQRLLQRLLKLVYLAWQGTGKQRFMVSNTRSSSHNC